MTPHKQRTWRSCLQACVASILELPLDRVPDVDHDCGEAWWDRYNRELADTLGLRLESVQPEPFEGYWIAIVPSLNLDAPGGHVVVMRGRELAHDPAAGERYERVEPGDVSATILLVPLDLAGWRS